MKELVLKYALQNAVKFNGKADPGALIGKVLGENPELKNKLNEIKKEIMSIVEEVNSMKPEEQLKKLQKLAPELLEEKKVEKKELKELPGAEIGKIVTRMPPEPSKYLHLGHALTFLINYMYAEKYQGKCVLRFEDCNPEKVTQEFIDADLDDIQNYLGIKPSSIVYVSDHMDKFYEYAEQLITEGKAYMCFCDREKMQDLRHKGKECDCRKKTPKINKQEWENMLKKKYQEGECTLRLKIDMKATNQVLRDPVIFRINYAKHYKYGNKYHVWPLYDFYNAIEEHLCGVNYVLRSNEFGTMRTELQNHIRELFGMKNPKEKQYGRFNINDKTTQGREVRELIEKGEVNGWDDPRLVTLKALKRRGIEREVYYELIKEVGLTPTQTNLDFTVVAAINRRILDKKSNRYFVLIDTEKIKVDNAPKRKVKLPLHPEDEKRGYRTMDTESEFYITKEDLKELKTENKLHRLMDCMNLEYKNDKFVYHSQDHDTYKNSKNKGKIINYLPVSKDLVKCTIMMDDATVVEAIAEPDTKNVKVDDKIQAERFAFLRLDSITKGKYNFWFTHK